MRLFASVALPDRLAEDVAAVQELVAEAAGIDLVDPEQAHVTLKFLGEVPDDDLDATTDLVAAAVEDAAVDPFQLSVEGLGVFPSLNYVNVVWLGVDRGGEQLTRLHERVEARAVDAGFDPEDNEFTPHVTIARMDHAGGKERVQEVVRERDPAVGSFEVEDVQLTESELTPEGPVYSTVASFEL